MEKEKNQTDNSLQTDNSSQISWEIPEYQKPPRGKAWYILASILALFMLGYAFYNQNFLFALLIIIAIIAIVLNEKREAVKVQINLTEKGVWVGKNFYDYDEIKDFSIVYKPEEETKKLYFEFKNTLKQRLSLPLEDRNPVKINEFLSQYLEEDLDRDDPPLSEELARLFRL